AHGGAWYIGMLATPGIPELLLTHHERAVLGDHILVPQTVVPGAPSAELLDALATAYRHSGFRGATDLYRSLLREGDEIRELAAPPLTMPVLTVSGSAGEFVPTSLRHVAPDLRHVTLPGVGHYIALEAPQSLAGVIAAHLTGGSGAREVSRPP